MSSVLTTTSVALTAPARVNGRRCALVFVTIGALALAYALGASSETTEADPDLVRLLQFMAALKGVFALVALAACYWRLARPASAWREVVYVAGPGVMAAGAVCLWHLQSAGLAALALHAGMFALLAAGLTDETFIPAWKRCSA